MNNRKKRINELENEIENLRIRIKQTFDEDEKNALLAEKKKKEKDLIRTKGTKEEQLNKERAEIHATNNFQNFKRRVTIINEFNVATKRFITTSMSQNVEEKVKTKGLVA